MLRIILLCLVLVASLGLAPWTVLAQSPQDTLNQYVSALQSNPNDTALREKIIKHVQSMSPAPAIPEEARRNFVMAKTLFKEAKNIQDYKDVILKFKRALLLAPWWGDAYLELGLAAEAAQEYDEAIFALRLGVIASSDADKSRKAQDEIYIIEAKKEKTSQERQAAENNARVEAERREAPKLLLSRLKAEYDGATYTFMRCSHLSMNGCFQETGRFPCGCNEDEYNGNYWYSEDEQPRRISFPNDGSILISSYWHLSGWSPELRGRPKSGNIEDIAWEDNRGNPVWFKAENGLNVIFYSPYFPPGVYPGARPLDSSRYSSATRYEYYYLKRR